MNSIIDTRGLSCPQPVMATLDALSGAEQGSFTILVDTDTSKENVVRAVENLGWNVKEIKPAGIEFSITITKS